jgi:hypothetical protein
MKGVKAKIYYINNLEDCPGTLKTSVLFFFFFFLTLPFKLLCKSILTLKDGGHVGDRRQRKMGARPVLLASRARCGNKF